MLPRALVFTVTCIGLVLRTVATALPKRSYRLPPGAPLVRHFVPPKIGPKVRSIGANLNPKWFLK